MDLNQQKWNAISAAEKRDVRNIMKSRLGPQSPQRDEPSPGAHAAESPRMRRVCVTKDDPTKELQQFMDRLLKACQQQMDITCVQEIIHALYNYIDDFKSLTTSFEKRAAMKATLNLSPKKPQKSGHGVQEGSSANSAAPVDAQEVAQSMFVGDGEVHHSDDSVVDVGLDDVQLTPVFTPRSAPGSSTSTPGSSNSKCTPPHSTKSPKTDSPGVSRRSKRLTGQRLSFRDEKEKEDPTPKDEIDEKETSLELARDSSVQSQDDHDKVDKSKLKVKKRVMDDDARLLIEDDHKKDGEGKKGRADTRKTDPRERSRSESSKRDTESKLEKEEVSNEDKEREGRKQKDRLRSHSGAEVPNSTPERLTVLNKERLSEAELQEKIENKLLNAKENRERLEQERRGRLQQYHTKITDASGRRERMLETQKLEIEQRMERAESKAKEQLAKVSTKAHDEVCACMPCCPKHAWEGYFLSPVVVR